MRVATRGLCAALAVLAGGAGNFARADFLNPGFETGDFTGWQTAGNALVVGTLGPIAPSSGGSQARLSSAARLGTITVFQADLERFLGLTAGTLDTLAGNAIVGAALAQDVTVNAGDVLTFDWNFLTSEATPSPLARNDFSFVTIVPVAGPGQTAAVLADTSFNGGNFLPAPGIDLGTGPVEQTGPQTFTFTFATAGTFRVGVGVVDVGDNGQTSGLLVDNFRAGAVPEPAGLALAGAGVLGLLGYGLRRRRGVKN